MEQIKPGKGWAWVITTNKGKRVLCHWAVPSKKQLMAEGKPSPEAKAVRVTITKKARTR